MVTNRTKHNIYYLIKIDFPFDCLIGHKIVRPNEYFNKFNFDDTILINHVVDSFIHAFNS